MSISFTIGNKWTVLHEVELKIEKPAYQNNATQKTAIHFLSGSYRNFIPCSYDGLEFSDRNSLGSITVDGKQVIEDKKSKVLPIFRKIQKAVKKKTVSMTLVGKNLTIITGQ